MHNQSSFHRKSLWAALFFPQLTIDMQARDEHNDIPVAVVVQEGARRLVMSSNEHAHDVGIHPGLTLNGAYAIAPELQIIEYDETLQKDYLTQVCLWATQFSSWVTPRMPNILLLEINASLKLFGGIESLVEKLHSGCEQQSLNMHMGIAPTPTAASLFARIGNSTHITNSKQLQSALEVVPTEYLPFDSFTLKGLRQSGIKQCKQLLQIPPAALTRRFGQPAAEYIYKLTGKLPDICPAFSIPESFSQRLDLAQEAPDTNALHFPLNRLTSSLGGFLRASDLGIKSVRVTLSHHQTAPTILQIAFLEATADHKHVFKVIAERLSSITLPEPATAIGLTSCELDEVKHNDTDLFRKVHNQSSNIQNLIDTLTARLGDQKLYTPILADDHRPEKAWYSALISNAEPPTDWPARPLWLLKQPTPATTSLEIQSTAERIENGWWDKADVRRDYYIARDGSGAYYWVFTERGIKNKLFIHGLFS